MSQSDSDFRVVTLHIEGVNIDNLPLEDIGAYLEDFASLLGEDVQPRYHSIKRNGLILKAKIPASREIDVKTRGFLLRTGGAPEDAVRARERISMRLGIHHAKKAALLDSASVKIVEIPIDKPAVPAPIIPGLIKAASLQGKVIRIGGRQDPVSVEIQDVDGFVYLCKATRDVAKRLAHEMFDPTIRVHGTGRWIRQPDGVWRVEDFLIGPHFEILEDDTLVEALNELRRIPSDWKNLDDASAEVERIRNGGFPKP